MQMSLKGKVYDWLPTRVKILGNGNGEYVTSTNHNLPTKKNRELISPCFLHYLSMTPLTKWKLITMQKEDAAGQNEETCGVELEGLTQLPGESCALPGHRHFRDKYMKGFS